MIAVDRERGEALARMFGFVLLPYEKLLQKEFILCIFPAAKKLDGWPANGPAG
jgi:hypothetical protein